MKKFVKLAAVFAALVLALSCFVSCSSDDDDDESVLAGLWIYEEDGYGYGYYVVGNKMFPAYHEGDKYYYIEEEAAEFTVSGNEITVKFETDGGQQYTGKAIFAISGNKLTLTYYDDDGTEDDTVVVEKVNKKPTKVSTWEELPDDDDDDDGGSTWVATDGSGRLTLDNGKYTCVIGGATYTGTYEEMATGSGKLDGDIGGVYSITGNTMKVVITRPAGSSGTIEFTKK